MSREIKFRVWNGEQMVSPDYIDRSGIAYWKENSIPTCDGNLMQFIGLKDKNGKDIYEGDIIRSESKIVTIQDNKDTGKTSVKFYRIGWHKSGCWHRYTGLTDDVIGITGITISNLRFYEVIGNIYENPELLNH